MRNVKNRLDRLEHHFARIRSSKRNELLLVDTDETVDDARARKYPDGVPDDVCLLTLRFV